MSPRSGQHGRPPWWPANEEWPPRRRGRPPIFAAIAFFALAFLLANVAIASLVGIAASRGSWHLAIAAILALVVFLVIAGRGRRFARMGRRLRRLSEAASRLEAADQRRRGFLADLAHELRTPLAVIRAQSEAISDGVYPGDPEHVAPILEAARSMEALVADLRTLAESDVGSLTLARERVSLAEVVPEVVATLQVQAGGVEVVSALPAGLPDVDADPDRVRRVLVNLLQNALAHTPAGGRVRVEAQREADKVAVTVADSGAGMDPDLAGRAFERFAKGPLSRGSGLGLSIARDLVEAHGGTISLESAPGHGTAVRFTLPVVE